ncbi:MAG: AAA family ATPase [Coriobacteriales bacterium]|jgi:uncharacterized protein YPO0396|nr:AAA family ATPase [Coriobacteriales bacterium]
MKVTNTKMLSAQEALFNDLEYLNDPASLHPGQWRLARIETANWGTFNGYQTLPVSRRGLLITGPSGSGKSTLLDAITTVLTPPINRKLNAAALGASNAAADRTICSYVRGAWRHETDDTGEIANTYLRPNVATWSGILLRYESQCLDAKTQLQQTLSSAAINLIALFNLKAGSNSPDGLSVLYATVRGEHLLKEFEPYAINGIDIAKFNREQKSSNGHAWREHSSFAQKFCRDMGIGSNTGAEIAASTAGAKTLVLLHKTQAAKNFGSLDDLFRRFMLDDPITFKQADDAVERFTALNQAYAGVVEQRQQMQHLEPLLELDSRYHKSQLEQTELEQLQVALDSHSDQLVLEHLMAKQLDVKRKINICSEAVYTASHEQEQARAALTQAQAAMDSAGGKAFDDARLACDNCQLRYNNVLDSRKSLANELASVKMLIDLPVTQSDWQNMLLDLKAKADVAAAKQVNEKDSRYATFGQVSELKAQLTELRTELRHLRSSRTNIPAKLAQIRLDLATHVGIMPDEFPFIGEMINVKPEEVKWRGAIERLLGNYAKTLLVSQRHVTKVSEYLEKHHLGIRLEYQAIPAEVEVTMRSTPNDSLVKKLNVRQHKHHIEFSNWLNQDLRKRFNYTCVNQAQDMQDKEMALTLAGQIKKRNHYVKDDRFMIDDRSRWVLGDANDEKIDILAQVEERLKQELASAEAIASATEDETSIAKNLLRLSNMLQSVPWSNYDELMAKTDLESSQKHYNLLKSCDGKLRNAETMRDEAQRRKDAADAEVEKARIDEGMLAKQLASIQSDIDDITSSAATKITVGEKERDLLNKKFKQQNSQYDKSADSIRRTAREVRNLLQEQSRIVAERLQKNRLECERTIDKFKQKWPLAATNLSSEFGDLQSYLGIYKRIKANGLPEYEKRFMQVLHDFSQDQITVLATTVRAAFREVKDKLVMVNKSLKLSEYSPGIHLQIDVKDNRSKQVTDFLNELQAITKDVWSETDLAGAEARYLRTDSIIRRFRSDETADKKWKSECLDTRLHVCFTAKEIDNNGNVQGVYQSDAGLSGGQKQKLVIFCLAAALRYQLADEDQPIPSYGTVVLDEAFDKADHQFAAMAMDIFKVFGFHMVLATPLKLLQTLERHIGAIASISCADSRYSRIQMIDFGDFAQKEAADAAKTEVTEL